MTYLEHVTHSLTLSQVVIKREASTQERQNDTSFFLAFFASLKLHVAISTGMSDFKYAQIPPAHQDAFWLVSQ